MIHPSTAPGTALRGRQPLGRILLKHRAITETQLEEAVDYQLQHACRIGEALVKLGHCSDVEVACALAEQMDTPFVDLRRTPPSPDAISLIPRGMALEQGVLPVSREGGRLLVVALNAVDIRIDELLRQFTGLPVLVAIAPESQIREHLQRCYGSARLRNVDELIQADAAPGELEVVQDHEVTLERIVAAGDDISAAQILSTLVSDAVRKGASDIHIEPQEQEVRVRYRIDGVLVAMVHFDRRVMLSVAARTKVMCGMDLAESRKPQDGGCRVRVDGAMVELRASTLPGVDGEVIVFRILARNSSLQRLDNLGLAVEQRDALHRVLAAPSGMILVTGPTGSGKTTTLYAALGHLNRDDVNIVTVEDPVELRIPRINQVQVDERAGRTFSGTLRAMLRQDPDIIMVGEIRDTETVEIACRAALTGHLVLSTLHTRHAFGTLSRLSDMGVSRFNVAASVNAIMAQRLLPRVCDDCSVLYAPPVGMREFLESRFGSLADIHFRRGSGCPSCRGTGSRGRVGVYELLVLDGELRRLIAEGAERSAMRRAADQRGFLTLEEDAFRKACQGLVAPEEVLKLCAWIAPSSSPELEDV